MPKIKQLLSNLAHVPLAQAIAEKIADFTPLVQLLELSINDDTALSYTIKHGFDLELDRLRSLSTNGHEEILKLEQQERLRTGITSLKIGYTHQTGYYIEITNPNLDKVPADFMAQQTMVGRKRFISQQLKALEVEILQATAQIEQLEATIFARVKLEVAHYLAPLRHAAQSIAYLDGLFGFAAAAHHNRYITPEFNDRQEIIISAGRHPVVEESLGHLFVPNNTNLTIDESLWVITGPNMGGKSTYLRQVGLICIMAQCGSLVPAGTASLPILDRIFTRIGSGDNVAQGKSTFLVEMEETAVICTQATSKSLVILDEVGRGTSTFDGIALAQAIIEHIFTKITAKCLFATHYHELTELAATHQGIKNYHLASTKKGDQLLFLHKIEPGVAPGSFGLDVAKLAGLPHSITQRAKTILHQLQATSEAHQKPTQQSFLYHAAHTTSIDSDEEQLHQTIRNLELQVTQQQELLAQLTNLDINNLTPRQALEFIWDLKEKLNEKD
jgi:DNA mismatch repair protein MutS